MDDIYTKLYQQTCHAFGEAGTKRLAECKLNIEASATHTLKGMDLAQYFLVAPLIDALLEHLPKPVAKEVFKKACKGIGDTAEEYFYGNKNEKENVFDVVLARNRAKLRELGIPKEQFKEYGGEAVN